VSFRQPPVAERVALPVRYPDVDSRRVMDKRAWWLLALGFLIPGSAQVLAGNRRLGRFGLVMTIIGWVLVVVFLVLALVNRSAFVAFATTPFALVSLQILVVVYVVLWVVLTLDTLRLTRLVRLGGAARAGVGLATAVLLVLFGGGGAYAFMVAGSTNSTLDAVFGGTEVEPPVDGYYNILLIGADSGEDRDGLRPDSTTVLSVEAATGHAVMYGLPRDLLYVPFSVDSPMQPLYPNGYGWDGCAVDVCQLNSIYTEVELFRPELYPDAVARGSSPGIQAMLDAASGALGIPIQYYVLIDMQGFAQLIDALGGITVNVQERLPVGGEWDNGENIVPADYWLEAGVQVLSGYNALWYARSRYTTSDYDRMNRQREVQEAILRQFDPGTVLTKFADIMSAGSQAVRTDIPRGMFSTLVDLATKARDQDVDSIEMTPPTIDPANPDYGYMQSLVASSRVQPTPAPTP
jgi:LCP family protein required for cell wall assembly